MGSVISRMEARRNGPESISIVVSEDVFNRWTQLAHERNNNILAFKVATAEESNKTAKLFSKEEPEPAELELKSLPLKELEPENGFRNAEEQKEITNTNQSIYHIPDIITPSEIDIVPPKPEKEDVVDVVEPVKSIDVEAFPSFKSSEQEKFAFVDQKLVRLIAEHVEDQGNNVCKKSEEAVATINSDEDGSGDFCQDVGPEIPKSDEILKKDKIRICGKCELSVSVKLELPTSAVPVIQDFPVVHVPDIPSEDACNALSLQELSKLAKKALSQLPNVQSLQMSSLGAINKEAVEKCEKVEDFWISKLESCTTSYVEKMHEDITSFLKRADQIKEDCSPPMENHCASYYAKVAACYVKKKNEVIHCRGIVEEFTNCVQQMQNGGNKKL